MFVLDVSFQSIQSGILLLYQEITFIHYIYLHSNILIYYYYYYIIIIFIYTGMVATAARTILSTLDSIPNYDNRTKIGFITYDSTLHFYNLNVIFIFLLYKLL